MTASIADIAGIIQGIGSLAAVGAAVWIYAKQYSDKKADDENETRAFVQAVKHEIGAIWNRHAQRTGNVLTELPDGAMLPGLLLVTQSNFFVYANAADRVGRIDDEVMRNSLITIYALLRDYFSGIELSNHLFQETERFRNSYTGQDIATEMAQKRFAMAILARSLKKSHIELERNIPDLMTRIDTWLANHSTR